VPFASHERALLRVANPLGVVSGRANGLELCVHLTIVLLKNSPIRKGCNCFLCSLNVHNPLSSQRFIRLHGGSEYPFVFISERLSQATIFAGVVLGQDCARA
jgi:hypothetical protein